MAYVDRPILSATPTLLAQATSNATYKKPLLRTTGLFSVLAVRSHTITIDEDDIDNTFSVHGTKRARNDTRAMHEQQARRVPSTDENEDAKPMALDSLQDSCHRQQTNT